MTNLLTILTARTASERLPGKALAEIKSRVPGSTRKQTAPLIVWIARRLRQLPGAMVAATTNEDSDNELAKVLRKEGIEVVRGSTDDVIDRMDAVVQTGQYPGMTGIFRALGDCPFIHVPFVEYAARMLDKWDKDAFVWMLNPEQLPVYSAREFPYSLRGWAAIARHSTFREHPDQYFHQNRDKFRVIYHQPPESVFFRASYRLEVDYEPDLEFVRAVADGVGMLSDLKEILLFLDKRQDIARINADCVEKTGPLSLNTYSNSQRRNWLVQMIGKPMLLFPGNEWLTPPDKRATPVFCTCGQLIGWGLNGKLHLKKGGHIMTAGFPLCDNCGLRVREWKESIPRRAA
jgi:spore coat polysaccharide biosynthesis protein SpsF